jgi:DNA modification methylase
MTVQILQGDCRDILKTLPDQSVHCCVTSPPYWAQRDYGVDGQLGREPSLYEHLDELVAVFREMRRVLRDDGTFWLNYGDAWATKGYSAKPVPDAHLKPANWSSDRRGQSVLSTVGGEIKEKDLIGAPWTLAFALRSDGWWLRDAIIWHKENPPPTSVKDRTCPAHEYVFMLSKSSRYFYDNKAIEEPIADSSRERYAQQTLDQQEGGFKQKQYEHGIAGARQRSRSPATILKSLAAGGSETRKKRSVWSLPVAGFTDAHFATFPPDLIEPCIKAGCPAGGTVLDPFGGAGTTGLVADRLQRNAILIELNPAYAAMAHQRITNDAPLLAEPAA